MNLSTYVGTASIVNICLLEICKQIILTSRSIVKAKKLGVQRDSLFSEIGCKSILDSYNIKAKLATNRKGSSVQTLEPRIFQSGRTPETLRETKIL